MSKTRNTGLSSTAIYTTLAVGVALLTATFVLFGVEAPDEEKHAEPVEQAHHESADPSDASHTPAPGVSLPPQSQADASPSAAPAGDDSAALDTSSASPDASAPAPTAPDTSIASPASLSQPPSDMFTSDEMRLDTANLEFVAKFPEGAHTQPAYRRLMAEMATYRDKMRADADAEAKSYADEGIEFRPWEIEIDFTEILRVGPLVSALGGEYANTGGAHPNTDFMGVIAQTDTGEALELADLFLPQRHNSAALKIGRCEALKAIKIKRIGFADMHGDEIDCGNPDVLSQLDYAETTLWPSTEEDKAGGLTFYYAPYVVGAYAEGPYVVTVSQEVFAEDLRPQYKPLFAGEPKK